MHLLFHLQEGLPHDQLSAARRLPRHVRRRLRRRRLRRRLRPAGPADEAGRHLEEVGRTAAPVQAPVRALQERCERFLSGFSQR